MSASDQLDQFREKIGLRTKRKGGKRPFAEQVGGDDLHRLTGRWTRIRRLIDRDRNRYIEKISDSDGRVLRDVDVPLDQHRGHGADHSQPKAHP